MGLAAGIAVAMASVAIALRALGGAGQRWARKSPVGSLVGNQKIAVFAWTTRTNANLCYTANEKGRHLLGQCRDKADTRSFAKSVTPCGASHHEHK
jgi:hypothetical protein